MTTHVFCIHCTLPQSFCICASAPILTNQNATILFHPRELERRNSSGRLLKQLNLIEALTWHRLDTDLEQKLDQHVLLFPDDDLAGAKTPSTLSRPDQSILILDGTWQETQKMLRQSSWLKALPRYSLRQQTSNYLLRRNQKTHGLSTLEALAYYLGEQGHTLDRQELLQFFSKFQVQYKQLQNTGQLK